MITCYFDLPVLDWIARHLWCPFLDGVMPVVTHLADGGILWIALAVVLLCWPRYRKTGIAMGLALLMGLVLCNLMLKPLVDHWLKVSAQPSCYAKAILTRPVVSGLKYEEFVRVRMGYVGDKLMASP